MFGDLDVVLVFVGLKYDFYLVVSLPRSCFCLVHNGCHKPRCCLVTSCRLLIIAKCKPFFRINQIVQHWGLWRVILSCFLSGTAAASFRPFMQ